MTGPAAFRADVTVLQGKTARYVTSLSRFHVTVIWKADAIRRLGSVVADRRRAFSGGLFVLALADLAVLREAVLGDVLFAQQVCAAHHDAAGRDDALDGRAAVRAALERRIGQALQALDAVAAGRAGVAGGGV